MLKIALSGCSGRMGRVISDIVSSRDGMEIAVGFDIRTEQYADFPIYKDFAEYQGDCDVVIDFSNAALTERLLDYCEARRLPVVICTTGHSAEQLARIRLHSGIPFGQHVHRHQPDERAAQEVGFRSRRQVRR